MAAKTPDWIEKLVTVSEFEIEAIVSSFTDDSSYLVSVREHPEGGGADYRCTCPSPHYPCKHAITLGHFYSSHREQLLREVTRERKRRERELLALRRKLNRLTPVQIQQLVEAGVTVNSRFSEAIGVLLKASTPRRALAVVEEIFSSSSSSSVGEEGEIEKYEDEIEEEEAAERADQVARAARLKIRLALLAFRWFGCTAVDELAQVCVLLDRRWAFKVEETETRRLLADCLPSLPLSKVVAMLELLVLQHGQNDIFWQAAAGETAYRQFAESVVQRFLDGDKDLYWPAYRATMRLDDEELQLAVIRCEGHERNIAQAARIVGQQNPLLAVEEIRNATHVLPGSRALQSELVDWLRKAGLRDQALATAWEALERWPTKGMYGTVVELLNEGGCLDGEASRLRTLLETKLIADKIAAGKKPSRWAQQALAELPS